VRFGISTHIYHHQRLTGRHLRELAEYGFDRLELFATRSHFDYHDAAAIDELAGWLREGGMSLHSIHAPIVERHVNGQWIGPLSLAAPDEASRTRAVRETAAALEVARRIPVGFVVVHLGYADPTAPPGSENSLRAATRSLEEVCALAAPLGVRVAVEVIPNRLSSADALVRLLEDELELPEAGICLDFGHASLMGDLVDAIETVSGLLTTTHVHDNRGREDDHLAPFEGTTDWDAALLALQKVGYEGALVFEVAGIDTAAAVLAKTRLARQRLEALLDA
jgi:sugar phosphate isomerase/epimerase